ncbi:outer arm dynein light chain 1 [Heliocybe sulcata]|uniref:Outer arm dynein light chain 1 n=1 Tax=Heliocybe sulcata TaxID=5364 RepID=A0A5C3NBC6_9AGAM|nr:outer arm dynein light chain 1 [Heliocybe sulcata]
MSASLPAVGTRLSLNASLGTVRYVGPVDGTQGVWLGVEWDDPARGKHDGKRYFTCILPHATPASFIRPTAKGLSYGRSFLAALAEKYIDASASHAKEVLTLGSSQGLIQVEAVGLDRVRSKLSDLSRLREVSLDGEGIAWADPAPTILETCPNIQGLDLSLSLLPSWPALASLTSQLPFLARLALNSSRLSLDPVSPPPSSHSPPGPAPPLDKAFPTLTELQLNATLTSWPTLLALLPSLPRLHSLELGYNHIPSLPSPPTTAPHPSLHLLNLDTNDLTALPVELGVIFPRLDRLVLAANKIASIQKREKAQGGLEGIRHLSLSNNPINDWPSIDNLTTWFPALEGLAIREIPLLDNPETGAYTRQFAIAKIPTLTSLDGAPITPKDRLDAELFYLSYLSQHVPPAARTAWGRWDELVEKHGAPSAPTHKPTAASHETLSSKLIQIILHLPPSSPSSPPTPTPLRILPTMPLRTFRLRILKLIPPPKPPADQLRLYVRDAELDVASDGGKEVGWWLEEGAEVVVKIDG